MSDTRNEEERAFDALIVSQLRRQRDILNLEDLPKLSDEDVAVMNSLPENIIETIWAEECSDVSPAYEVELGEDNLALAGAADHSNFGMYRSVKMEEEDKNALDASREEAREEIRRRILKEKEKRNG